MIKGRLLARTLAAAIALSMLSQNVATVYAAEADTAVVLDVEHGEPTGGENQGEPGPEAGETGEGAGADTGKKAAGEAGGGSGSGSEQGAGEAGKGSGNEGAGAGADESGNGSEQGADEADKKDAGSTGTGTDAGEAGNDGTGSDAGNTTGTNTAVVSETNETVIMQATPRKMMKAPVANDVVTVNSNDELVAAVDAAPVGEETTIYLGDGEFTLHKKGANTTGKTLVFVGAGTRNTTWRVAEEHHTSGGEYNGDYSFDGTTSVTFKDMTLEFGDSNTSYLGFIRPENTVVENCVLNGISSYWGNQSATFKNSTFNAPSGDYAIWTGGAAVMTFEGCTFNTSGKTVNVYDDYMADKQDVIINWKDNKVVSSSSNKAALNINDSNKGSRTYTINISGNNEVKGLSRDSYTCTDLFGFGGILKHHSNNKGNTVVNIDGTTVWSKGKMVAHEVTKGVYSDGYTDDAYRTITLPIPGSNNKHVTKTCKYCGWQYSYTVLDTQRTNLSADMLITGTSGESTEHDEVYAVTQGDTVSLTGALSIDEVRTQMTAVNKAFPNQSHDTIQVSDIDFSFTTFLQVPNGMTLPSDLDADDIETDGMSDAFEVQSATVNKTGDNVTIKFGLKNPDQIKTYADLESKINGCGVAIGSIDTSGKANWIKVTVPGIQIADNAEAGKQLTATGSVDGTFTALATAQTGTSFQFSYAWSGTQIATGKDKVASSDNTIQLTVKVGSKTTYLPSDMLVTGNKGESTEHDAVYAVTQGEQIQLTGAVQVSEVQNQIAAIENEYPAIKTDPALQKAIQLSNMSCTFEATLTIPSGMILPASLTKADVVTTGFGEVYAVTKDPTVANNSDGSKTVTITFGLKDANQIQTYYDLKTKVNPSTDGWLKVTIPGITIDTTNAVDTQLTATGTVSGQFAADAQSPYSGSTTVKHYAYQWNGVQWANGKDAAATDDKSIQLTVKVTAPGSVTTAGDPPVKKVINGDKPAEDGTFRFIMTPSNGTDPLPNGADTITIDGTTSAVVTIETRTSDTEEFGTITFDQAGTYTYTISELDDSLDHYTYDSTTYTVEYTVTNVNGALQCTRTINGDKDATVAAYTFTNTYKAPVSPSEDKDSSSSSGSSGKHEGGYGNIYVYAVDSQTGKGLAGTQVALYKSNGEYIGTYTTDENGYVAIKNMPYSTYYLQEVVTPDGYTTDPTAVRFELKVPEMNIKVSAAPIAAPNDGTVISITTDTAAGATTGTTTGTTASTGSVTSNTVGNATGDDSSMALYGILCLLAGISLIAWRKRMSMR